MTLGRIGGAGRVTNEHHVIAGDTAGPDIVVWKEADWSLLLGILQRTLRRVLSGKRDKSGKRAIDPGLTQALRGHDQIETRHLGTSGKPVDGCTTGPGEVVPLPLVDGAGDEHAAHTVIFGIGDALAAGPAPRHRKLAIGADDQPGGEF